MLCRSVFCQFKTKKTVKNIMPVLIIFLADFLEYEHSDLTMISVLNKEIQSRGCYRIKLLIVIGLFLFVS